MVHTRTITSKSPKETKDIGKGIAQGLTSGAVVALHGELGSGKTTFAQGFAEGLGIRTRLLSPTFIIVRRYPLKGNRSFFYHVDLYRIEGAVNSRDLGLDEFLSDQSAVVLIEWAEYLGGDLPVRCIDVSIRREDNDTRTIEIQDNR
jgi:tRNA threonylcarbamoyladenosine biosynthesis protein TsaE